VRNAGGAGVSAHPWKPAPGDQIYINSASVALFGLFLFAEIRKSSLVAAALTACIVWFAVYATLTAQYRVARNKRMRAFFAERNYPEAARQTPTAFKPGGGC